MKSHYCSFRPPPVPGIEIRLPGWWEVGRQSRLKIATVTPGGREREVHLQSQTVSSSGGLLGGAYIVFKAPLHHLELVLNVCFRDISNRR